MRRTKVDYDLIKSIQDQKGVIRISVVSEKEAHEHIAALKAKGVKVRFSPRLEYDTEFIQAKKDFPYDAHVFIEDDGMLYMRKYIDADDKRLRFVFDHLGFVHGVRQDDTWIELLRGEITECNQVVFYGPTSTEAHAWFKCHGHTLSSYRLEMAHIIMEIHLMPLESMFLSNSSGEA